MSKKKNKNVVDQPAQLDSMFNASLAAARTKFGTGVSVGSVSEVSQVGLPLPALSLRYLFQANIFPLGRIWQLAGQEGSCKSALLLELLRWHLLFGGGGTIMENENKDSEILRHGILEYRQDWIEHRVKVTPTNSCEEWQAALTLDTDTFSHEMDKKGGVGRTVPILFGIDSLTGTDTQHNIDKASKDGFSSKGFADQAAIIARYMRTMPSRMRPYPFTVVGTNHLKPATDVMGRPTSNIPGGKAVPFMATFMIESKRITDIEKESYSGIRLNLKMTKNSLGPSRREIVAEFLWWMAIDPETGFARQHFHWDWHTATVEMLLSMDCDGKKKLFKQIKEITGLEEIRSKKMASSEILGIPESDPVSYRDWGKALESRPEIMRELYPLLGIGTYRFFEKGVDFRAARAQAEQEARHANAALYADLSQLAPIDVDEIDPLGGGGIEYDDTTGEEV